MFNNIGEKIKSLTKVIFWLLTIPSILAGIFMISIGSQSGEMEEFIYIGIGVAVGGPLFFWISSFVLYGYGELISNTQKTAQYLELLAEREIYNGEASYSDDDLPDM